MTNKLETYKCEICGNIVEVLQEGAGELVCCGENMTLLKEHQAPVDDAHYAHVEYVDNITKKVTFNHPMTSEHHFDYIEAISNDGKYVKRKFLNENEAPELSFKCDCKEGFYIRLYCNIHGLWITRI